MHNLEVGYYGVVHVLPEERLIVEDVQRDAIGELDQVELGLLGHNVVDAWFERWVRFEHLGADAPLYGGLDFGFGATGEAESVSSATRRRANQQTLS